MAYGIQTFNPVESYARGQQQGYAKRLSDIQLEEQRQAQMEAQRKDIAQAARWVMSQPEQMREQSFNQALDFYEAQGEDVSPFRGRMDVVPMLAELDRPQSQLPAGARELQFLTEGMSEEDILKAKRIRAGLDPRAVARGARVVDVGGVKYLQDPQTNKLTPLQIEETEEQVVTPETVAESKALIAEQTAKATEGGKISAQLEAKDLVSQMKAQIATAQKSAEAAAKGAGEDELAYRRLKASMPSLTTVVGELRDLSNIATETTAGRLWDAAVRETGFGATEGSTAASKYDAIVKNQVLPLLKATLGAAFTDNERLALEATMGDQSKPAVEKQAQLDAFMQAKMLELESKERFLGLRPMQEDAEEDVSRAEKLKRLEELRAKQ